MKCGALFKISSNQTHRAELTFLNVEEGELTLKQRRPNVLYVLGSESGRAWYVIMDERDGRYLFYLVEERDGSYLFYLHQ